MKQRTRQICTSDGKKLYEGETRKGKPYGAGKAYYPDGTVYQEGEFGIKGLLKGKEYYPNGNLRFEGIYEHNTGYGPNYPIEGKCYDEEGNLYYEGKIKVLRSGLGWPRVEVPEQFGSVVQEGKPEINYTMWEDVDE